MTNIIELARQAGAEIPDGDGNLWEFDDFDIFHFAELIRADERAALDAPEPTVPDNMQDWKGMDGAIAWHLIERHADNWADIGKMMGEWLAANQTVLDAPERDIGRTLDQFLCNGTRIKLNFNRIGNMTSLQNMAHDLQGRWVALVPAENDCHLKRTEYVPLSDARITSLAYDCNAMPESCTDESLKLFARAIEQEVRGK